MNEIYKELVSMLSTSSLDAKIAFVASVWCFIIGIQYFVKCSKSARLGVSSGFMT